MSVSGNLIVAPNPVILEPGAAGGRVTLSWSASGTEEIEVRVGTPDGPLFCRGSNRGEKTTDAWVQDGTEFFLQNVSDRRPLTCEHTLAKLTVHVDRGS